MLRHLALILLLGAAAVITPPSALADTVPAITALTVSNTELRVTVEWDGIPLKANTPSFTTTYSQCGTPTFVSANASRILDGFSDVYLSFDGWDLGQGRMTGKILLNDSGGVQGVFFFGGGVTYLSNLFLWSICCNCNGHSCDTHHGVELQIVRAGISCPTPITVTSVPEGLAVTVDAATYTTPQTFQWAPASNHTIAAPSPQAGTPGTQQAFSNWSDGGAISHAVSAPAAATTYTATFATQYQLSTAVSPAGTGTITPATGYFDPGDVVVTATPAPDHLFTGFSGALTGLTNPQTLSLAPASTVTANFVVDPATIPTAAGTAANVTALGGTTHVITVTYADNSGIDPFGTIGTGDVTVSGPGGYLATPDLISVTLSSDGVIANYQLSPPGGVWDLADAGTYTINMIASQVLDISGNAVPAGPIGSFEAFPPVPITVTTNPAGLGVNVDGVEYTSPQTFQWLITSTHTIITTTPQSAGPGTQHVFESWSDGGLLNHDVTVSAPTTFTAQFKTQHLLTTAASPVHGGSISPASGFFDAGNVSISATPSAGFDFTGFDGAVTGTTNPQTLNLTGPASVTANFVRPPIPSVIDSRIGGSSDDAEESAGGSVSLSSNDLELVTDGTVQTVGIRFRNLTIPKGATITAAYVQFAAEASHSGGTSVTIRGQRSDNAPTFTSSSRNISNRTSLTPGVLWPLTGIPWSAGQTTDAQKTPDLSALVQEIVSRPGWSSGNALAMILTGSGRRNAYSYDGSNTRAPLLHVEYEISSDPNRAPIVDAGPNQTVTMPTSMALLNGTVSDEGLPRIPGSLTTTWEMDSGPVPVAFGNANAVDTDVTFTQAGTYVLKLTAFDGALSTSDLVTLTVLPGGVVVQRRVSSSSDDAEEKSTSVSLTSNDLDLGTDGSAQTVGMRFTNLAIPRNATITHAHVAFRAREANGGSASIVFQAQAIDHAPTFTTSSRNITNRTRTAGAPPWTPGAWAVNSLVQTTELKTVIQAVVSRSGWSSGNALALIATGSGHRSAFSYDGSSSQAPLLYVEYTTGGAGTNRAPVVNAGPGHTLTLPPGSVLLDATVSDDGLPTPAAPSVTWSQDSGPGTASFTNAIAVDTRVTFDQVGTYVLRLTATDGALSASDSVTIHVQAPPGSAIVVDRRGAAGSDDAEESSAGDVNLSSSDLELVDDGSLQTVGMRFPSLAIPRGAQILAAWVQLTADETQGVGTSLTIQGEAADHSTSFTTSTRNVSTRSRTVETVSWSPDPWLTTGIAGPLQKTNDLSSVIQRIVNRAGWGSGNALSLIVTGTGHRTAVSWDGDRNGGPLLHIEYTTAPALAQRLAASRVVPEITSAWVAPNPFHGSGTLWLSLARSGDVTLSIFDVQGRRIGGAAVFAGLEAGRHPLQLGSGTRLEAGLYFYQLTAPGAALRGRFLVVQ